MAASGGTVIAKPWGARAHAAGLFSKSEFKIDLRTKLIWCPAGEVEPFEPGETVQFDPEVGSCPLRNKCSSPLQAGGAQCPSPQTSPGRSDFASSVEFQRFENVFGERVAAEHALAHIASRKGNRARYLGARKNLFDLRRAGAIQNLEAQQRILALAA